MYLVMDAGLHKSKPLINVSTSIHMSKDVEAQKTYTQTKRGTEMHMVCSFKRSPSRPQTSQPE